MGDIDNTDIQYLVKTDTSGSSAVDGSMVEMLTKIDRETHEHISVEATITGNGATVVNVFKFTGTVRIISQEAEISEVTDITTCSAVYATLYDGTNTVDLTKNGIDLSGAPVGSYFTKDQVATETYSLNSADQVRLNEVGVSKKAGLAFTATAKNGVDNFIQFRFTGDANTSFKMKILFCYTLYNGSTLELV